MEVDDQLEKFFELEFSTYTNDVDTVRKLLQDGIKVDPTQQENLLIASLKRKQFEIIKLLVQNGADITQNKLFTQLWAEIENPEYFKEILRLSINHHEREQDFLQDIFYNLYNINDKTEKLKEILTDIFEVLLGCGLSLEKSIHGKSLLSIAIEYDYPKLLSRLLELGVDTHESTYTAVTSLQPSALKILLDQGICDIYHGFINGNTALHYLCDGRLIEKNEYEVAACMKLFLENDFNILNILNNLEQTAIMCTKENSIQEKVLVKKIAELKFENQPVSDKNLMFLQNRRVNELYQECLNELQKMKETEIYDGISLHSISSKRTCQEKIQTFKGNQLKDFVIAFTTCKILELLNNYGSDLKKIFVESLKTSNITLPEVDDLCLILDKTDSLENAKLNKNEENISSSSSTILWSSESEIKNILCAYDEAYKRSPRIYQAKDIIDTEIDLEKRIEFFEALRLSNLTVARNLMEEGVSPNLGRALFVDCWSYKNRNLIYPPIVIAVLNNDIGLLKLLIEYGAYFTEHAVKYVLKKNESLQEIIKLRINKYNDVNFMLHVASSMIQYDGWNRHESTFFEIFDMLLDHGMPIDGHVIDEHNNFPRALMYQAIHHHRNNLVLRLLRLGADPQKLGYNILITALFAQNKSVLRMALEWGIDVNEPEIENEPLIHCVCRSGDSERVEILKFLLDYGIDVNTWGDEGERPIVYVDRCDEKMFLFLRRFAKMEIENEIIHPENLQHFENDWFLSTYVERCRKELEQLMNIEFYEDLTLYDFLGMRKHSEEIMALIKKDDFIDAFQKLDVTKSFKYFGQDLDLIFQEYLKKRNYYFTKEDHLYSILKHFPIDSKQKISRKISDLIASYAFKDFYVEFCIYEDKSCNKS